jgi:poly(3-hydroxyalkanoate) synthetase
LVAHAALVAGCAAPAPNNSNRVLSRVGEAVAVAQPPVVFPMTLDDIRRLTRDAKTPSDIIAELDRTSTVLDVRPSEVAALLQEGVSADVLDWLHRRQLDALGDTWKGRLAQQQQDQVRELQRLRNEMELRALSRQPFGYYPYYRYGPGWRFGF